MFKLARFAAAALICGGVGLAAFPASAETWRLSSMMTPDSIEGQAYQKFADLVDQYTDGKITVKIYPNEQIGSMDSVVEQLSQGIIQLAPSGITFMSRWEDGIKYAAAPFLFKDYAQYSAFIDGPLFQGWLSEVDKKAGIGILGHIPDMPRGSFRVLASRKPITSIDDFKGLKVRQYQNDLVIDAWKYLGAEVRVLPWTDVYDGINRGIVDAVTSPAESVESMRFYEVAPDIIRTDEYPQAVAWMMNQKAWDKLTPDEQDALTRAHKEASAYERDLLAKASKTLKADLEAKKGVSVDFDFDTAPIFEKMKGFYAGLDQEGKLPKGLLDAVNAANKD